MTAHDFGRWFDLGGEPFGAIPVELADLPQWMVSYGTDDYGKLLKRPRDPRTGVFGSKTDPGDWSDSQTAFRAALLNGGFPYLVVTREDPFGLIDFDGVIDRATGEICAWAAGWLDRLGTYGEVSTSGGGVRAVVRSDAHFKSSKRARLDGRAVEVYARDHGCIMTGRVLNDAPINGDVDGVLAGLQDEVTDTPVRQRHAYRGTGEDIEDLPIPGLLSGWMPTRDGVIAYVECPWEADHTMDSGASQAAVGQIVAEDGERGGLWFRCMHAHCEDKRWEDFRHVSVPPRVVKAFRVLGGSVLAGSAFGGAR